MSAVDVDTSSEERPAPVQEHENPREAYRILLANAREQHHAELREKKTPLGWAMRTLHNNQLGAGSIYELHNMKATLIRIPAQIVVGALYGMSYDIHRSQVGVLGTPEGRRMERVYSHARKYPNEVEYLYSFVQIITACTASFAHGANDVGNAVGVWAAMYSAWSTGETVGSKAPVPLWQIAVIALTICFGFITYGYNIMRGKSYTSEYPQLRYRTHANTQQSWATRSPTTPPPVVPPWRWVPPSPSSSSPSTSCQFLPRCASLAQLSVLVSATARSKL
jgi:phosphate/sulfate permease